MHSLVLGGLLLGEGDGALGVEELADPVAHDQGTLHVVQALIHTVVGLAASNRIPDEVLPDIVYFLYVVSEFI